MAGSKEKLTIVLLGDINCGKQSLTNAIIWNASNVDEDIKNEFNGRAMNDPAGKVDPVTWCVETLRDEGLYKGSRSYGKKFNLEGFESDWRKIAILPSDRNYKDFIKHIIIGYPDRRSCAGETNSDNSPDAAIIVVSAAPGEYEASYVNSNRGQEIFIAARMLRIGSFLVAINKMDMADQARFDEIKAGIGQHMTSCGLDQNNVEFIPVSSRTGENISSNSRKFDKTIYAPLTLCEAINNLPPPADLTQKPLRCMVNDVYKIGGIGTVIYNEVASGILKGGQTIKLMPANVETKVKTAMQEHKEIEEAKPRMFNGAHVAEVNLGDIRRGGVIGLSDDPPKLADEITATIIACDKPITPKMWALMAIHRTKPSVCVERITQKLDPKSGKVIATNPGSLQPGEMGTVVLTTTAHDVCVEAVDDIPDMARFYFGTKDRRSGISSVDAIGVVESFTCK